MTFLQEMARKLLVVEWLSRLPCKRYFIDSIILETQKDITNTLPSLKLLEQRVHELVGGPLNPPLDNVLGSKMLRSGGVKGATNFSLNKWGNFEGSYDNLKATEFVSQLTSQICPEPP